MKKLDNDQYELLKEFYGEPIVDLDRSYFMRDNMMIAVCTSDVTQPPCSFAARMIASIVDNSKDECKPMNGNFHYIVEILSQLAYVFGQCAAIYYEGNTHIYFITDGCGVILGQVYFI